MGNEPLTISKNRFRAGMSGVIKWIIPAILAMMVLLPGCATVDRSVNFLYQPAASGRGGSGDLYLAQNIHPLSGRPEVEWIVGDIKDGSGEKTGNIVSSRPPVDTLMEAFSQELKAAGYSVIPVEVLPDKVAKGIKLTSVSIRLEEIDRVYKVETRCTVKVSLEPWRNGVPIKRLYYESSQEESTLIDRDMILLKSEQTALQQLLDRAVKEVIVLIEQN